MVESRCCTVCSSTFTIEEEDLRFFERASLKIGDSDLLLPPPTQCPLCRLKRRAVWRNEYTYYHRNCEVCDRKIISVHDPQNPYPVYCNQCWWNDNWNPLEFGQEYDFSRPFFEQFHELQNRMPKPAMANDNHVASENIEYCQGLAYSKNCYLVTTAWRLEDSLYSANCGEAKELVDCRFVGLHTEMAYECTTCQNIYGCSFLDQSENCNNCHFGVDLRGCSHCIGCYGLRQQKYRIFNEQLTESEFMAKAELLLNGSYQQHEELKQQFEQFKAKLPRRAMNLNNCEDTVGNNLFNCKNFHGFNVFGGEECKYYYLGTRPQHCYDILVGGEHQWCYEGVNPDHSFMSHFTVWCWKDKFTLYSDNCHTCENLFGCIGLRRKDNCILNKSYSPDEYERLVVRIYNQMRETGEWGEFFPIQRSPFAYNETIAQDHFRLTPERTAELGYQWKQPKDRPAPKDLVSIPDNIADADDSITKETLACKSCTGAYRITQLELNFYRKLKLPVPRCCPTCRRLSRFERSGSYDLKPSNCANCNKDILFCPIDKNSQEIYCDGCYAAN